MKAPERTTAEAFPRYVGGEVLADSTPLKWPGLFARRYRYPRVVDGFLVPATAEPLIAYEIAGSAEFEEREVGGPWLPRRVRRGDLFVTRSKTPYELRWRSPLGAEIDVIHIHLGVDQCLAAFEQVYQDKAGAVEVTEFFGRDEMLGHLSLACADMLSARIPGNSKRVAAFAHLLAIYIAEKYTNIASERPDYHGGLPIARLRKVEDYVRAHLIDSISIEKLAELAELSPFHFSRVFNHGYDSSAIRHPRAHTASSATDPRNLPQPHRNRARSRLHESKPFRSGISTGRWVWLPLSSATLF
jgi:AraC family transcriptional regulator